MAGMIRKRVYIEPRQERLLKTLARQLGLTEADLIRRGTDQGLQGVAAPRPHPGAWQEIERFILARMRKGGPRGRRRWTREALYDR